MSTLSAGTRTAVIGASGVTSDKVSRSAPPAHSSNAEVERLNTSKSPHPQVRPDVLETSHSSVQTPKQQSGSGSIPVQQRAVECPGAMGSQSMLTSAQQAMQSPGVAVSGKNQQDSNSARLVGPKSARSIVQAQQTVTVDLTNISDTPEGTSGTTRLQASHGDQSALELGKLVNKVREVRRRRQRYADEARSFDLKLRNAELTLDELLEGMKTHMKELSGLHEDLEKLRNQVAGRENKVEAIRQQADRTRDTANRVTLECRALTESKGKAEKAFANTDKELDRLLQALDIL
jgi:chromosome segregation ATPase